MHKNAKPNTPPPKVKYAGKVLPQESTRYFRAQVINGADHFNRCGHRFERALSAPIDALTLTYDQQVELLNTNTLRVEELDELPPEPKAKAAKADAPGGETAPPAPGGKK